MERLTASGLVEIRSGFVADEGVVPNANDPVANPPGTVGPPSAVPGASNALNLLEEGDPSPWPHSTLTASPWSGWPADWPTPLFGHVQALTDTAWACLDLNASLLATMPPYLVGASPSLPTDWINNPNPDLYGSWEEFAKQLFWDFQNAGEVFILATAYYANGYPSRFHVVPPWYVEAERVPGGRRYTIGNSDVTDDIRHIRYQGDTSDAHGHGPLEVAAPRLVAANALARYASGLASSGGIPNSVLKHPGNLNKTQAEDLQTRWVAARMNSLGLPAVLSGGVEFEILQMSPKDLALVELSQWNESRIAVLLGVPPFLMGLPSGGDSLVYSTTQALFDYHWRAGLRPKAATVMSDLSAWLLPRGTTVELNRDEYVRPGPFERAQTWQILVSIGVLSVEQVQEIERFAVAAPSETLTSGVLQ